MFFEIGDACLFLLVIISVTSAQRSSLPDEKTRLKSAYWVIQKVVHSVYTDSSAHLPRTEWVKCRRPKAARLRPVRDRSMRDAITTTPASSGSSFSISLWCARGPASEIQRLISRGVARTHTHTHTVREHSSLRVSVCVCLCPCLCVGCCRCVRRCIQLHWPSPTEVTRRPAPARRRSHSNALSRCNRPSV